MQQGGARQGGRRRRREERGRPGLGVSDVPGYTELEEIGRGATSTVYRAWQATFRRTVALKVAAADVDRAMQRRFERESALAGSLSGHPNVVTVYDAGLLAGRRPYLAMEHFERGSLADVVARSGPLSTEGALRIAVKVAGALETAHRAGILHRDIKPHNVLLSRYDEPALADFGIATLLLPDASVTAGLTPVHAAPEILEGDNPTVAADIYALGSTVFTLLAGTPPFAGAPGEGVLAQLMRIMASDLPPVAREDVPTSVVDAIRRAMAREPAGRYPSAEQFGRALQAQQASLGLAVTEMTLATELGPPSDPGTAADDDDTLGSPRSPVPAARPGPTALIPPPPPPPSRPAPAPTEDPAPTVQPVPRGTAAFAGPTPAGAGTPPDGAMTGGAMTGDPTVIGRRAAPAGPSGDRRRRWPWAVLSAAVAIPVVAVVAVVASSSGGSHHHHPNATPPPATSPGPATGSTSTTAPATSPAGKAPTDVAATLTGSSATLHWTDHTGGTDPQLVYVYPTPAGFLPHPVASGMTQTVISGLDPTTGYCFEVVAVVAVPAGSTGQAVTATSAPACVNGAQPSTITPQGGASG